MMWRSIEERCMRWVRRWLVRGLMGGMLVMSSLMITGLIYQTIATAQDREKYPPPGQMIDVGGYRLHVQVAGTDQGRPTVILDAAWGSASPQWGWIMPELAGSTRVVAFDRPGVGYSDAPPDELTIQEYTAALHLALEKAGVQPPYVLVGHSMASLTSRAFANFYPEEVVGLVLIDPRYFGIAAQYRDALPNQQVERDDPSFAERTFPPLAAQLGIFRLTDPLGDYIDQLPEQQAGEARTILASTHQWAGSSADALLGEEAAFWLFAHENLGNLPVIILSGDTPDEAFGSRGRERFTRMHQRMATELTTAGEHRVLAGANHYTLVMDQRYAQEVAAAIHELVSD